MEKRRNVADEAAEAFYGQNETNFMNQIRQICSSDPRLVNVFKRTRETYLDQKAPRH